MTYRDTIDKTTANKSVFKNSKSSETPPSLDFQAKELSNFNSKIKSIACKVKKRRAWTPERRAAQALRAKAQKPWLKSSGPKTAMGKAKSSQNAYEHGFRSAAYRHQLLILRKLLRLQAMQLKAYRASSYHSEDKKLEPSFLKIDFKLVSKTALILSKKSESVIVTPL